ncbi:hypothetical protein IPG41_06150 [Candidatus Peregrinibacteria bacterium]|nr:MAG: hypothetical protein IPG41_06150 [Candidatus Peregrinibacteria bacterium]
MKNTLKKIGMWIGRHKKVLLLTALGMVFIFQPEMAHAEPPSVSSGDNSETVKAVAEMVNLFVRFLNTLLWPLLLIIGDLLDVDMITGPGMEERLLAIWVEMRNLVNIAIALLLVVVAFYNVLGLGGGEGELAIKTVLPKIVLGLILVNFTYVGGKVILDVANVGTTIAFALPQVMEQSNSSQFQIDSQIETFQQEVCYPKPTVADQGTPDDPSDDVVSQGFYSKDDAPIQTELFCELATADSDVAGEPDTDQYGGIKESLRSTYFSNLNKNNVAIIMAVNMGSLGSLELLKSSAVESFKDLTVNSLFAVVMYIIFAISYVVLAAVLVVRLIVLWLALALSPLAVLTYVVPQIKEWLGGGGDFTQKVIKHLVAPIIIGLTMSMGFLLMDGWSVVTRDSFNAYSDTQVTEVMSSQFLVSGIDDLPKLILAIASIAVVWMGVFAAANDTYAAGLTNFIKEKGEAVGGILMKAPLRLETIPFGTKDDPQPVAPLSIMGLMDDKIREYQYGNTGKLATDRSELEDILRQSGWSSLVPEGGSKDPLNSSRRLYDNAQIANKGLISANEAKEMARDLANIVEQSGALKKAGTRDDYLKQLTLIQEKLGSENKREAEEAFRDLQELAREKLTADDIGIREMNLNGSQYNEFIEAMKKGEEVKFTTAQKEAENPRTQIKQTPAAVPALITEAQSTANGFAGAVSAIKGEPTAQAFAERAEKTQSELAKARDAVTALGTDFTDEKKGLAAIQTEKAQKETESLLKDMQADAQKNGQALAETVTKPIEDSIAQLEALKGKLTQLK